jgi:hypothetical protein
MDHPLVSEVFQLTDQIVHGDAEVRGNLERTGNVH